MYSNSLAGYNNVNNRFMNRLGPAMAGNMRGNMNRAPLLGNRLGPRVNSYNNQQRERGGGGGGDFDHDGPAGGLMSRVVVEQGASREEALEEAKKVYIIINQLYLI